MASSDTVQFLQGQVKHVVDPSDFWMCVGTEGCFKQFEDFEKQLNVYCRQQRIGTTESVTEYSIVLVNCTNKDGKIGSQWRRATVHRINREKDSYDVFYQDYGNNENVPAKRICEFVSPFIQHYPAQCHKYALAGIKPIASSWTSRGVKLFTKLATGSCLLVVFHSFDNPTMCYRVALYPSEGRGRSLTHEMLDQLFGEKTDEEVAEFISDVTPVQYGLQYGYSAGDCDQAGYPTFVDPSIEQYKHSHSQLTDDRGQHAELLAHQAYIYKDVSGGVIKGSAKHEPKTNLKDMITLDGHGKSVSPELVMVPGFNLSLLQQRRMLSAAELQREAEAAAQAERKARLQQDIMECHRDLDFAGFHAEGSGEKWGSSGHAEVERQTSSGSDGDVYDRISAQIHLVSQEEELAFADQEKALLRDLTLFGPSVSQDSSMNEVQKSETSQMENKSPTQSAGDDSNNTASPVANSQRQGFPTENAMTEEEEYNLEKKFRSILHELNHGEDPDFVCAKLHSLVPVEKDYGKDLMEVLLHVLLEEGVKSPDLTSAAVSILDTYTRVLDDTLLRTSLRHSCDKFVKLPVGKMPSYHINFACLLVKLLQMSVVWPTEIRITVEDISLQCLERWIIFNKKGSQTGAIHQRLEAMYVDCVQVVVPATFHILREANEEVVHFLYYEAKSKILESEVDYAIRARLLDLLYCFQFSPTEDESKTTSLTKKTEMMSAVLVPTSTDQSTQTDTVMPMEEKEKEDIVSAPRPAVFGKNKATQTEKLSSRSSDSNRKRTALKHADTQTDPQNNSPDVQRFEDAGVQTDQPQLMSQHSNTSVSSNGMPGEGTQRLSDSTPETAGCTSGRARRRRVLLERLQCRAGEQEWEGASVDSSPTASLSLSLTSVRSSTTDEGSMVDSDLMAQTAITPLIPFQSSLGKFHSFNRGYVSVSEKSVLHRGTKSSSGRDYHADGSANTNRVRVSSPSALSQLSLHSIATGILGWSADELHTKTSLDCQVPEQERIEEKVPSDRGGLNRHTEFGSGVAVMVTGIRGCHDSSVDSHVHYTSPHPPAEKESPQDRISVGIRVLEGGSGDNSVPDDWEMCLTPEEETVGPAGDAPLSVSETSSGSVYADCQQDLDLSSAGGDAEGGSAERDSDRETPQPVTSGQVCQHKRDVYGFEDDSDDSGDSFFEAEPDLEETVPGVKTMNSDVNRDVQLVGDVNRDVQLVDVKYQHAAGTEEEWSAWDEGVSKEYGQYIQQDWNNADFNPLAHASAGTVFSTTDCMRKAVSPNASPGPKVTSSLFDLGCLPGEVICTMPRLTSHIRDRHRNTESLLTSETSSQWQDQGVSTTEASGIGYERGDLAGSLRDVLAPPKQRGGKTRAKFRPLSSQHHQPVQPAEAPRPWVPAARCTKCGEEGHLRYDCQKTGGRFFYD